MSRYIVDVVACDETTYVSVELSDEQLEGIRTVAALTVERQWYGTWRCCVTRAASTTWTVTWLVH